MKKLVSVLLIVVIVFNFILCRPVYADKDTSNLDLTRYGGNAVLEGNTVKEIVENGRDSRGNEFEHTNYGTSIWGILLQLVALVINVVPVTIQGILSLFTENEEDVFGVNGSASSTNKEKVEKLLLNLDTHFTIEKTVFNEISFFNIDFFDTDNKYELGIDEKETFNQSGATLLLKETVAVWFYTCRALALMINMIVLIYIGIRMAVSTIVSDQVKYKKMLIDWLISMVIVFLLPYIMVFIIGIQKMLLNIMFSIRKSIEASGQVSFEEIILKKIYWAFNQTGGMELFLYSIFFWCLTWMHCKFFFAYLFRTLTIFFLTIISPFITVTYPIDKIGDGKAQAFDAWYKEYLINVMIQPIHAATYIIFIFTAGTIAVKAPFIAMLFLLTLGKVENIIRNIFGLNNSVTMQNMSFLKGFGKGN